jgi:hypothetical protein
MDQGRANQEGIMRGLAGMAVLAAARGHHERAARLLGAAESQRERVGLGPFALPERAAYERARDMARTKLDVPGFERVWAGGRALPLQEAVAEAMRVAVEVSQNADDGPPDHRESDQSRATTGSV